MEDRRIGVCRVPFPLIRPSDTFSLGGEGGEAALHKSSMRIELLQLVL